MKKNRIISYVVFLMLLITFMSTLFGCSSSEKIPIPKVENGIYVYDEDNVIDDTVENELNTMLVELEEKTETEFVVISVESLLDKSIEEYANNLFNTLGIGKKGKDNGLLLLFSRSDEKVRLEIGRGLEGFLNDSKCGRILDDYFVPYRDNDQYTKATEMTVKAILSVISEEYNISIDGLDYESIQIEEDDESTLGEIVIRAICIIILLIFVEWITGYIFGNGFGDGIILSGSSSRSGRFSGRGSSGRGSSGGRFGGGFSGGGGASR